MKTSETVFALGMILLSIYLSAYEFTPLSDSLEASGFELVDHRDGVTVYKSSNSNLIEVAAEGVIDAPPLEVRKVLLDYRGQQGVVKRVSESRILKEGPGWMLVYQMLNLPVISDRDFTLKVKWGADGDNLWIIYEARSDLGPPERSGVVRVTYHEGSWQLKPISGGDATLVRFQAGIDMAGWLPMWLARSGAGDEIPELFASFRKMVANDLSSQR